MATLRNARLDGRHAGINAASWKFDGNTTRATYEDFLTGSAEGDPEVMDAYAPPDWLSGEWAGESMNELLDLNGNESPERVDALANAYTEAAESAYWRELERVARLQTVECAS